ncbi:MAG TPA: Ig-like domain repeat protein [Stellaceae bacterium]|nr:Ig-like domain repeat protein [Stellaceae bacterium]
MFAGAQPTTTALASNPNPSVHNQPVTFTATVTSGSGTPTGTVTFLDSGQAIGAATLAAGVATFTTSSLSIGTHSITASYGGANTFLASTSAALSQAVNVPLDSLKLRALQVQATQIAAQISGDAFSEAVEAAITDGFSDEPAFATPSADGIHVNMSGQLAAGQQLSDAADAQTPDPALGRAAVLSDLGTKPAPSTFASLTASSNAAHDQPAAAGPTRPGASDPKQVASLGPTQAAAAPTLVGPSPTAWQAWADVRGSGWDNSGQAGDIHGTQVNTLVGLTRRLAPDFLIGALAGYEHFDYSSQLLNGRLTGDGWTVGGYMGWRLDPQLRFDAALARSGVNYNGVAGTATGSFPGSRWIASAGLTGTYQLMPFEIEPSAKVFALWEHEDSYTDSLGTPQAAFHFTTGRGSGGLKVSYPTTLSDGTILKPYVGFYGDYYFSSNNANTVLVPSTFIRGGAARVTAGITAHLDSGIKLALGGEYGGIGNNFQNWTVMGRLSVPLSTLFGLPTPMAAALAPAKTAAATPAKQVASLQPVADGPTAPIALTTNAPAVPPERIVVRFSEHALFLTAEGRQAFDRAVVELLAGKPVQVAVAGCEAGADFTDGSLCARRQASLQQLLEQRGVVNSNQALAGP